VNFLKRFKRPAEPPDLRDAVAELQTLARQQPALAAHARCLADCLPVILAGSDGEQAWQMPHDQIAAKWSAGMPLLRDETITLDRRELARKWKTLCAALSRHTGETERLANAVASGDLDLGEFSGFVLAGESHRLHQRAEQLGLDAALTATVLRWTLFSQLSLLQAALAANLPDERWPHGYCPICGSWPAIAEFRGLEQMRFLRCGLCAMAWEFPRLKCPYCGNDDHRRLGYLHPEGEESKWRIATCDDCRGYLKSTAAMTPLAPARLLVLEVATLPLDLIAADRGFAIPAHEHESE
jgi:FdhE protein